MQAVSGRQLTAPRHEQLALPHSGGIGTQWCRLPPSSSWLTHASCGPQTPQPLTEVHSVARAQVPV
jgi:hypothetical protein